MITRKQLVITALSGYDPCPHCIGPPEVGYDEHTYETDAMAKLADKVAGGDILIVRRADMEWLRGFVDKIGSQHAIDILEGILGAA